MLEARIQQQFFDAADLLNQSAQALSPALVQAVAAVVGCLTSGGKIVACAQDGALPLAQHAAAMFTGRFERARPPLPALALSPEAGWPGAFAQNTSAGQALVQQIQALGQPGDVLLMLSLGDDTSALQACVQAAHEKELTVVACLTHSDATLQSLLRETDVAIVSPTQRLARVLEQQMLILHCLCDAVDAQLLGEQDLS